MCLEPANIGLAVALACQLLPGAFATCSGFEAQTSSESLVLGLQAVTGLHMAGVLHRDVKPKNMLIINNDLVLHDFDVSCLANSSDATLQSRVGPEELSGGQESSTEQWMTSHP